MWWTEHGMHGWGAVLMTVGVVLFWGMIITALIAVIRRPRRSEQPVAEKLSGPEDLLAERFARGDIDEGECRQRLDVLRGISGGAHSDRG
jgi:putative membrane protein